MGIRVKTTLLFLLLILPALHGQEDPDFKTNFLTPSEEYNKARMWTVGVGVGSLYAGTLVGLNSIWYSQFNSGGWHFFNDGSHWLQVDKAGHYFTAYFESYWMFQMYKWTGMERKKAAWWGAASGWFLQATIEVMDGFQSKWGASGWDLLFNTLGSATMLGQELAWQEQRIKIKYNFYEYDHPDAQLQERGEDLFGSGTERFIKDYNALSIWASFNLSSFFPNQQRAKWLNVAVGYGGQGLYGGDDNIWEDDEGDIIDRSDVERYRQFFISLDVDFERIKARTQTGKFFLGLLNIFKFPAPAIEFNTRGEIIFHPLYFMNWEVPLTLKKAKN